MSLHKLIFIFGLFSTLHSLDALPSETIKEKKVEWGLRGGVIAPFVSIHNASVNEVKIGTPSVETQVGYIFSLFGRVNMKKHFLQLEAVTTQANMTMKLNFDELLPTDNTLIRYPTLNIGNIIYAFEVPLLYGYNFVKNGPYQLAFMIGPSFRYIFKEKRQYNNSEQGAIFQKLNPLGGSAILGLETRISNLFIDFRYEIGVTTFAENIDYTLWSNEHTQYWGNAKIERVMNQLSFSIGFIF